MKAYHLRTATPEYRKDYLYVPERNLFIAFFQKDDFKMKMNYSMPAYIDMAQSIIEGRSNNALSMINPSFVKAFEIDEQTVSEINKCLPSSVNGAVFDNTTEGLVRILSEDKEAKARR